MAIYVYFVPIHSGLGKTMKILWKLEYTKPSSLGAAVAHKVEVGLFKGIKQVLACQSTQRFVWVF